MGVGSFTSRLCGVWRGFTPPSLWFLFGGMRIKSYLFCAWWAIRVYSGVADLQGDTFRKDPLLTPLSNDAFPQPYSSIALPVFTCDLFTSLIMYMSCVCSC